MHLNFSIQLKSIFLLDYMHLTTQTTHCTSNLATGLVARLFQILVYMKTQWRHRSSFWLLMPFFALAAPAYAMQKCPNEFGTKAPIVDVLGWAVVSIGVIAGMLILAFSIRRSASMRWHYCLLTILAGLVGLVLFSFGGLALATVFFFLKC
jgi:hypothetical protein